jgi:hypothetical protein
MLGSSTLASLSVIALIGVLLLVFGQRVDRMDRAVAAPAATVETPRPVATQAPIPVAPAPRSIPQAAPASTAAPVAPALPVVPAPSAAPGSDTFVAGPQVVIFDQTRQRDLVVAFRSALRSAGWDVAGTGPWYGAVPVTTVYYPAGQEAAAKALMAKFPEITRSLPVFDGVPADKLTVIICKDFKLT